VNGLKKETGAQLRELASDRGEALRALEGAKQAAEHRQHQLQVHIASQPITLQMSGHIATGDCSVDINYIWIMLACFTQLKCLSAPPCLFMPRFQPISGACIWLVMQQCKCIHDILDLL